MKNVLTLMAIAVVGWLGYQGYEQYRFTESLRKTDLLLGRNDSSSPATNTLIPEFQSYEEAVAYRNGRFSGTERSNLNNRFKANGTSGDPYFDAAQNYIVSHNQGVPTTKKAVSIPAFYSVDEAVAYRNRRFSGKQRDSLNKLFKRNGTSGDPYFDAAQNYIVSHNQVVSTSTKQTSIQKKPSAVPNSPATTPPNQIKQSGNFTASIGLVSRGFLAKQNYTWLTSNAPIPQYVLDEAIQFRSDFLKKNSDSASNLSYGFFYDNRGNACLEATVTPKGNYTWKQETWIRQQWNGSSGAIGLGEIKYTKTQKNLDEAEIRIEERRKNASE